MISTPVEELARRAESIALAVGAEVLTTRATVGGGSLPGETLESRALALGTAATAEAIAGALRQAEPTPIVGRVADGRVVLDLRTVAPEEDAEIVAALGTALAAKKDGARV